MTQELGVPIIDQEIFALMFLSAASFVLVSTLVRVGESVVGEQLICFSSHDLLLRCIIIHI